MKWIIATTLTLLVVSGCSRNKSEPNIELIQDMMEQPAVKAQKYDPDFKNGISDLVPPENTQPVGFKPYRYATNPQGAAKELKNPYAGKTDKDVLMVGQKYFETNCMVCHGMKGLGDGPVSKRYPLPIPQLVSAKVKSLPDGAIYHIITMGQGTMGSYASHVPQKYRWQLVNYIRHLQSNM